MKVTYMSKNFIYIFIIIYLVTRVVFLDQDLPPWGMISYQPIDEGTYSIYALNYYNTGSFVRDVNQEYKSVTPAHSKQNVIGNFLVLLGLSLFGDNYYGLRMPYVLIGLINALLMIRIFKIRSGINKHSTTVTVLFLFTILMSFPFYFSNRVAEPTSVRMMMILLIYLIYSKFYNKKYIYLYLGILTSFSILLVYVTNVFILFATILLIIVDNCCNIKKIIVNNFIYMGGLITGVLISDIYFFYMWKTSSIVNAYESVISFTGVNGYSNNWKIITLIKNVFAILFSNSFLYSLPIVLLFIIITQQNFYAIIKNKDKTILYGYIIIGMFWLQTMFSNDYVIRKSIVIFPLIVILTYEHLNIRSIESVFKAINSNINILKISIYLVLSFLLIIVPMYRLYLIDDMSALDFQKSDMIVLLLLITLPLLLLFIFNAIFYKPKTINPRFNYYSIVIIIILCLIGNSVLIYKYSIQKPTYSEQSVMIDLGKIANNSLILGEYEYGYTLYNDIIPVLNNYENIEKYLTDNKKLYYFDYYDEYQNYMRQFFDETLFSKSDYTVLAIKVFPREFQTFGVKRYVALYSVVSKNEAKKYIVNKYSSMTNDQLDDLARIQYGKSYEPGIKPDAPYD